MANLRITVSLGAALAFSLLASGAIAQNFDDVEIKREKVADGVYMLQGAGGNMGLSVGDDGAFLIDDQFAPLTDKILTSIAEVTDKPVEFLLNTHWHPDHTGGNENLGEKGALIVAHDNVRKRLTEGLKRGDGRSIEPKSGPGLPVVTFSETTTFHWNGTEIHAFHVHKAHTDGDAMVYFKAANVLHTGDVFFNGMYPYIDLESGGSVDGYIEAQQKALDMIDKNTKIIPGHGELATKADLEKANKLLREARDRIGKLVDAGKNEKEVLKEDPMAEYHEDWASDFMPGERFTRIIYQSLAKP